MDDRRSLRRLPRLTRAALRLVREAASRELATVITVQITGALASVAVLLIGRSILESAINGHHTLGSVTPGLVGLAVAIAAAGLCTAVQAERTRLIAQLVEWRATGQVIDAATGAPYESFLEPQFHDSLQRALQSALSRPWEFVSGVLGLSQAAFGFIGATAVVAAIVPWLVPFILLSFAPLWLVTRRSTRAYYEFDLGVTASERERYYLLDLLTHRDAAPEIRSLGTARYLRDRYDALAARRIKALRIVLRRRLGQAMVGHLAFAALSVLVLALLVRSTLAGDVSVADAAVAAVALQQVASQLRVANVSYGALHECSYFLADFTEFISAAEAAPSTRPVAMPLPFRELRLHHVSYRYPGSDRLALDDLDLTIHSGEHVAIVGENGSGKTTLVHLVSGLLQPTAGTVSWDGVGPDELDPERLRATVANVFQDFQRYQLSARENIGLGHVDHIHDSDRIEGAARQAEISHELQALPEGLDTRLSPEYDAGAELSIGQWQRLALARAFFRSAPLLILDEPSSALDPYAERHLQGLIEAHGRGRTVITISHRLSTVIDADRIVVLERGRVVETGTHTELLELGGRYAAMFRAQATPYSVPDPL